MLARGVSPSEAGFCADLTASPAERAHLTAQAAVLDERSGRFPQG